MGETFLLADGGEADVVALAIEHAAPGATFATYNFEVADFHTYFVGADGVWVHNSAASWCQAARAAWHHWKEKAELSAQNAAIKVQEWAARVKLAGKLTNKQYFKVLGEMAGEAAAAEKLFPEVTGPIWTSTKEFDTAQNIGKHFFEHVVDDDLFGGEIDNIITYVKRARDLVDRPGPGPRIGRRIDKDGFLEEVYFNIRGNGDFAVKKLAGPNAGAVKTYIRKSGSISDREAYWATQSITELVQEGAS